MGIKGDQGYIYFNELLYRCMRRKYGNMKINKRMQIFELRTQYNIYLMTLAVQKKGKKLTNDDIYNCIIKKENGVNPFLTVMNFKISFKTWIKFARKKVKEQRKLESKMMGGDNDYYDNYTSTVQEEEVRKPYSVEIEVETYFSVTSEEDSGMEGMMMQSQGTFHRPGGRS